MGAFRTVQFVDNAINAASAAGVTGIDCTPGAVTAACLRSLPDPVVRVDLANAIGTALPIMVPSDKVLGLDVASGGGVKPVGNFDAAHQCSGAWGGIVAF